MSKNSITIATGIRVERLEELEAEAMRRISRIGSCSMTTIDRKGRTRVRMINAVWENMIGYTITWTDSLKTKHVRAHPFVSLCYWDPDHQQVYADCAVSFVDDPDEKTRLFRLTQETPPPVGYDPSPYFEGGATDPNCAILKLVPWRFELFEFDNLENGANQYWRDDS